MPGFDGSGPRGQGPRTGRGFGPCPPGAAPAGAVGPEGVVYGIGRGGLPRGGGRGRGWGGGRGRWADTGPPPAFGYAPPGAPQAYGPPPPEAERAMLQQQADLLRQELDAIQTRLEELERED